MRRSKQPIQPKPPPNGMTPSREARDVLAFVVNATETPAQPHDPSNSQRQDHGCGPLFASRLLHVLRTTRELPPIEDPQAYYLIALYLAALDVKMMGRGARINPDNTTTQECRIIAGLEKLAFDWDRLPENENLRNPYENLADYAEVAMLPPMPWVDGADREMKRARRRSTQPTRDTRIIIETISEASTHQPTPVAAQPGTSTVRDPDDGRVLRNTYRMSKADLKRRVESCTSSRIVRLFWMSLNCASFI